MSRVRGVGPSPASILILGEGTTRSDEIKNTPLSGRAGEQLNAALNRAYIDRAACYVCNVIEDRLFDKHGLDRPPTDEECEAARADRMREIARVNPDFIITVGSTATKLLFPMYSAVGGLETLQGRGFVMEVAGRARTIIPTFHPAAGLRDSRRMSDVFWAISEAGRVIRGERETTSVIVPRLPSFHPDLCVDTETVDDEPWCATWAEGKKVGLEWLTAPTPRLSEPAIYHNALFDLQVLAAHSPKASGDTMVMAYHLGTEPLGLKELTFRHTGLQMTKYEDIVRDADVRHIEEWVEGVKGREWPAPEGRKKTVAKRVDTLLAKLHKEGPKEVRAAWKKHDLKELVEQGYRAFPRQASLADVPLRRATTYAKLDPVATSAVHQALHPKIAAMNLTAAYEADVAIIPMIARMQRVGMPVNTAKVKELEPVVREELDMLDARARLIHGAEFNIASADQVRDKLVEEGWAGEATTRGGKVSTSKNVLQAVRAENELADLVLEYRERAKNLTTFIPALLQFTQADGRIHPNFRTTNTETGRLSCHDPNLLAFPARSKLGMAVRDCFEAPDGWVFANADLDQIEMRLIAHEAQDETMIRVINAGLDMHAFSASNMFKLPIEECVKGAKYAKSHREPCKTAGFRVLYRGGAHGLHAQMAAMGSKEPFEYWDRLINSWYEMFPGVKKWQLARDAEADLYGYVRDMWGRIRHVEGVWSTDMSIRAKCQREASNFPIQSGAQGLLKRAMIKVWHELGKKRWKGRVEPVLQVHDELVFLTREDCAREWCEVVGKIMIDDERLFDVPLGSTSGVSKTWGGLK